MVSPLMSRLEIVKEREMDALEQLFKGVSADETRSGWSSLWATSKLACMLSRGKVTSKFVLGLIDWRDSHLKVVNASLFSLSLSVPSLSGALLSRTDWRSLNFPLFYAFSNSHVDTAGEFQPRPRPPNTAPLCLLPAACIDFQLFLSLLCCGLRQGASRATKNMLRVSMTTSARLVIFLPAVCGQGHAVTDR